MARRGRTLTLAITVGAALVAAPSASADSLVYEKDGNIWQARPDGTDQRQITTSGGFSKPTQADDGTIVAVKGGFLQRMDRGGTILNIAGDDDPGGPLTPHFSPNGAHVAYNYFNTGVSNPGMHTALSFATRETQHDEIFQINGWSNPTWVGNDKVLMFDGSSPFSQGTLVYTLGSPGTQTWYDDPTLDLTGGEIQAGNARFAATDGTTIRLYTLNGPPPGGVPDDRCNLSASAPPFFRPTWAPSGPRLAWQENDGIWMGGFDLSTCAETTPASLVIPGGKAPDWGPADVSTPPAPPAPTSTTGAGPGATVPAGGGTTTAGGDLTPPVVRVTLGQRSSKRRVLAGLTIPVRCSEACLITAELLVDRRTARRLRLGRSTRLARATKRLTKAGSTTVRLRPGKRLRARMRRVRMRQVTVRVRATDAAGNRSGFVTRTLRL